MKIIVAVLWPFSGKLIKHINKTFFFKEHGVRVEWYAPYHLCVTSVYDGKRLSGVVSLDPLNVGLVTFDENKKVFDIVEVSVMDIPAIKAFHSISAT